MLRVDKKIGTRAGIIGRHLIRYLFDAERFVASPARNHAIINHDVYLRSLSSTFSRDPERSGNERLELSSLRNRTTFLPILILGAPQRAPKTEKTFPRAVV